MALTRPYTRFLDPTLEADKFGLLLAWRQGYKEVECSVDSKLILDWISSADTKYHPCGNLIEDIRALMNRRWRSSLQHTLREGNFCADYLAKLGCKTESEFMVLHSPTAGLLPIYLAEEVQYELGKQRRGN
ncbi:hypothetical protein COLO4_01560 [Corchorus olitorius]|nr:hypothetical protein COLO4_03198 [Corchorus olitorius]OMP12470.1 hypothetical protein COLO4_03155 [Corchorus olitorius]OMP13495.1 hypothetical protein COLO4_01560 [Corchorus olitorius]